MSNYKVFYIFVTANSPEEAFLQAQTIYSDKNAPGSFSEIKTYNTVNKTVLTNSQAYQEADDLLLTSNIKNSSAYLIKVNTTPQKYLLFGRVTS